MKTVIATYKDALKVVNYLKKNHAMTGWDFIPFDVKRTRNCVVDMIRSQGADVIMAVEDGQIKGVILAQKDMFFWNSKAWYATDVHTVATGGGAACMARFIEWAREHGCDCIVSAVATESEKAEALYLRMGFERQGNALVHRLESEERAA